MIELVETFNREGIHLKSIDDAIDTSTATGTFFFHVIGAFSELERSLIRERTGVGLRAARARGKVGGRPETIAKSKKEMAVELYMKNECTVEEIAEVVGISRSTVYRAVEAKKNVSVQTTQPI